MEDINNYKFSFEQKVKDEVIDFFSSKQGGRYGAFNYHWQCFVWAATIGFTKNLKRELKSPIADRPFSLKTMEDNNGRKDAHALVCMCIAKAGTIDILKDTEKAINLINEYANGGFYWIIDKMKEKPVLNTFEWVKQEIFSREDALGI